MPAKPEQLMQTNGGVPPAPLMRTLYLAEIKGIPGSPYLFSILRMMLVNDADGFRLHVSSDYDCCERWELIAS